MTTFPSFDEHYRPTLQAAMKHQVDLIEKKINAAQSMNNVNEVERQLDDACDQVINQVTTHMNDIRTDVKRKGAFCTSPTDRQRYISFVDRVTVGIRSTQGLFDKIFARIRNIVKNVVSWIRTGLTWMLSTIKDTFNTIRSMINH